METIKIVLDIFDHSVADDGNLTQSHRFKYLLLL